MAHISCGMGCMRLTTTTWLAPPHAHDLMAPPSPDPASLRTSFISVLSLHSQLAQPHWHRRTIGGASLSLLAFVLRMIWVHVQDSRSGHSQEDNSLQSPILEDSSEWMISSPAAAPRLSAIASVRQRFLLQRYA